MAFDPARAGRVYGNVRAVWEQDGVLYDAEGQELSAEVGLSIADVVEPPPVVSTEVPSYSTVKAPPKPEHDHLVEPAVIHARGEETFGSDRRLALKALPYQQLARMVDLAGGVPVVGVGAKPKNIDWLLANTE